MLPNVLLKRFWKMDINQIISIEDIDKSNLGQCIQDVAEEREKHHLKYYIHAIFYRVLQYPVSVYLSNFCW